MTNMLTDPVCGMEVESGKNAIEYKGINYAFCSTQCQKQFTAEPEKYLSNAVISPGTPGAD